MSKDICKNFGEPSDIVGVAFAMEHCAICNYHKACVEAIHSSEVKSE